ncbi:MAG: twin-arginine translocation signal domain-containing protein [Alistipes sp.]|nr:twin-arginine translocation signal domain-containing protein [Candidatus Minthomonas equi]
MDRRQFIGSSAMAAAALGLGQLSADAANTGASGKRTKLKPFAQTVQAPDGDYRAFLMHLSNNLGKDWPSEQMGENLEEAILKLPEDMRPTLKLHCDYDVWKQVTEHAAEKGINMLFIDVGEGIVLPSHPELALEGSWSVERIREEIVRLNSLGMEVIPLPNFSTAHNGWMKDYRHMISSKPYYRMCEEVLADIYEIFGKPRFFHVGCDEEDRWHIDWYSYRIQRVKESWWCDFLHIIHTVEKLGARPWVWADNCWENPEYFERCPKSVIQQDWYYDEAYGGFDPENKENAHWHRLIAMWNLEKAGFDQVPCGTNWVGYKRKELNVGADDVIGKLVTTGRKAISKEHLKGFMMAPWIRPTERKRIDKMLKAIDLMADAIAQ